MRKRALTYGLVLFLHLLLAVSVVVAQTEDVCLALVEQAISQTSTACANMEPNTACYGHDNVVANFVEAPTEEVFSQVGQRAPLTDITSIQTFPANVQDEIYGVSVLTVQGHLPSSLTDERIVYVVLGGEEIENAVLPDDALLPGLLSLDVTTVEATQLRPSLIPASHELLVPVPANTTLSADAVSSDEQWVRVVYQNRPGWIARAAVDPELDLSALDVIGPDSFSPMQAFYLSAGMSSTECGLAAPPMLLIQGPEDIPVDIEVYDVPIRIESTIALRTTPIDEPLGQQLEIIVLFGLATLYPGQPNELIVPPGYITSIPLGDEFVSLGIEDDEDEKGLLGNWSPPRMLTEDELDELQFLEQLPGNILRYSILIPRIIRASGIGGVIPRLTFANPAALAAVQRACESEAISEDVCDMLLG